MNHERALRNLSIQHHLHIGATAPRPGFDDGSDRRPEAPRPAAVRPAFTLRTLFRRHR
ncbi:MAG TPA: hypothetical protein VKB31_00405 [Trueperaceae bacterium]|nr:hypothetical protein [Trueperaceae bacterium]